MGDSLKQIDIGRFSGNGKIRHPFASGIQRCLLPGIRFRVGIEGKNLCQTQPLPPAMLCEIQHIWRDRLIGGRPLLIRAAALGSDGFLFLARGIVIANRLNPRLDCLFPLGIQKYRGIGQPVRNGLHMIVEQWQPMFDAGGPAPFAHCIEHQIATGIAAKQHAIGLAKAINMLPVQHDFADRAQNHLGRLAQCALIHGIEPTDRL